MSTNNNQYNSPVSMLVDQTAAVSMTDDSHTPDSHSSHPSHSLGRERHHHYQQYLSLPEERPFHKRRRSSSGNDSAVCLSPAHIPPSSSSSSSVSTSPAPINVNDHDHELFTATSIPTSTYTST
ncbi:hypothetical protein HK102_004025, partial [Quaeritorhiza haematococci]